MLRRQTSGKDIVRRIVSVLLIAVFVFSTYQIVNIVTSRIRTNQLQEELLYLTEIEELLDEYGGEEFINVNFTELLRINEDTVGWIVFNQINFPIVQGPDNSFYLHRSFDRRPNTYGSIFMDFRNNSFYDRNTVIYGHSAVSGRNKFSSLRNLLRSSYFDEGGNDIIQISTPAANHNYQIFSVYTIESENYYITPRFSDDEFRSFLSTITRRSNRDFSISVGINDRILTLSTCYGGHGTTRRLVVHAKLVATQIRDTE